MKITKKHLVEVNMRRYHLAESVEEKQRIDEFIGKLIKGGKWIISKIKKNPIGAGLTGFYGHQLATDDQIGIGGRVYSADERAANADKLKKDAESWEAFKKYGAAGLGATGVAMLAKSIYDKKKEKKRQQQDENLHSYNPQKKKIKEESVPDYGFYIIDDDGYGGNHWHHKKAASLNAREQGDEVPNWAHETDKEKNDRIQHHYHKKAARQQARAERKPIPSWAVRHDDDNFTYQPDDFAIPGSKEDKDGMFETNEVEEGLFGAMAGGWLGGGKDLAGMAYGAGKVKKALSSIPAADRAAMKAAIAKDPKLAGMVGGVKDLVKHKMRKKALGTAAGAYLGHRIEKAVKDDDDDK